MANAESTAANCRCKAKTACNARNTAVRRRLTLAFLPSFSLDHRVSAADEVTSLTGLGGNAEYGAVAFTTT
jgi:hypothetical protein